MFTPPANHAAFVTGAGKASLREAGHTSALQNQQRGRSSAETAFLKKHGQPQTLGEEKTSASAGDAVQVDVGASGGNVRAQARGRVSRRRGSECHSSASPALGSHRRARNGAAVTLSCDEDPKPETPAFSFCTFAMRKDAPRTPTSKANEPTSGPRTSVPQLGQRGQSPAAQPCAPLGFVVEAGAFCCPLHRHPPPGAARALQSVVLQFTCSRGGCPHRRGSLPAELRRRREQDGQRKKPREAMTPAGDQARPHPMRFPQLSLARAPWWGPRWPKTAFQGQGPL